MADCMYFPYIGGENLGKGGELKMQKIQGWWKHFGNPRGGGDKKAKIQERSYEITEIPRGGGNKKAKIQRRPYKIIKIPRKFLGGLVN